MPSARRDESKRGNAGPVGHGAGIEMGHTGDAEAGKEWDPIRFKKHHSGYCVPERIAKGQGGSQST